MSEGVGITGRGLTARGPSGSVFENIDLQIHPGELAVVTGASGTGRTCMLLALSGRLRLVAGTLKVAGLTLPRRAGTARKLLVAARLRPGVELEPQHRVRQVVREREMISGVRRESIARGFDLVGIDPRPSVLVGDLHPVDQLLLAVALAAAAEPAGIVVDDVDHGLPQQHVARAWSALRAVARTGTTVLASALDPPDECDAIVDLPHPREPELPWQRDDPDAPTVEFAPLTRAVHLPEAGAGGTSRFDAVDAGSGPDTAELEPVTDETPRAGTAGVDESAPESGSTATSGAEGGADESGTEADGAADPGTSGKHRQPSEEDGADGGGRG
jgi:ABC-type branched-subunit amino acid transport system ATPase component